MLFILFIYSKINENMSITSNELKIIIADVLQIKTSEITKIGQGTYCYVYAISDTQVIKIYRCEAIFRNKYIYKTGYFGTGEFRECFLNQYLDNEFLLKQDNYAYHNLLGIYSFSKKMIGNIQSIDIMYIDEKLFFQILQSIISGLFHLHSHGFIHSDIKPQNILYDKDEEDKFIFKLCDFNLLQFYSIFDTNYHDVYATPHYSPQKESRTMMVDIYMLGTTLLALILSKSEIYIDSVQITMDILIKFRNEVIKNSSILCYQIIELMMLPQENRIYLNSIQSIVKHYYSDPSFELKINKIETRFNDN
jgi:serine/threonine protein kinase